MAHQDKHGVKGRGKGPRCATTKKKAGVKPEIKRGVQRGGVRKKKRKNQPRPVEIGGGPN